MTMLKTIQLVTHENTGCRWLLLSKFRVAFNTDSVLIFQCVRHQPTSIKEVKPLRSCSLWVHRFVADV